MKTIDIESLNLPTKLTALIKEIEGQSKHPISFRVAEDLNLRGAATFEDDVPCVYLRVPTGLYHITICHELLHLQCWLDDFPITRTIAECLTYDYGAISDALSDIGSIIEHKVIYPKMLRLSYDPYVDFDQTVRIDLLPRLEDEDYLYLGGIPLPEEYLCLVLKISRALLETSSLALRERVRELAQAKFPQALIVAERIVALIDGAGARTPQTCKKVLVDAVQILGIPKETYEISNYHCSQRDRV